MMARSLFPLWLLLLLLLGLIVVHAHVPPNLKDVEVNADGTTNGPTSRFNKKIDVEAMERQWQEGDNPLELEHEQMHIKKIQEEKLKGSGNAKTGGSNNNRLAQINKDTAVNVQFFVELQKPAKAGMKSDWKQNQAHMLGVKWRQQLISAGQSVSYSTIPVFKKVIKKIKGKKKKKQINNFLVAFTVEKGYQTVEIMKYLLKQQEVAQISLEDTYYNINDLTREEKEEIVRETPEEEEEEEEEPTPPPVDTNKKRKKNPTKSPSFMQNQPSSVPASSVSYPTDAGLVEVDQNGNPKQKNNLLNSKPSPKVHDPLHVNREGDEAAFGIQLYAELRMERTKGVGWTMPQGDELAKTWKGMLSTTYPGTKVTNYGHIGPPPVGSSPPPPRDTPPGMTLMATVEGGWKTYDVLKFMLLQKETDCVTVHGKKFTKKDLPPDEIDEDDD